MSVKQVFFIMMLASFNCCSQTDGRETAMEDRAVGGVCEGCAAVFEYSEKPLNWIDTLPDFNDPGPKLEVTGTIYHRDGTTPASDVLLYIYHTDQSGEYPRKGNETGWATKHGYIRGWIKTGDNGRYVFYTLKPGAYPDGGNPAHIHPPVSRHIGLTSFYSKAILT